ncbi:MAG TPA: hypothetical protein VNP73_11080 [Actinomycetota bacterium]|nr:hypothetical protein [Actinomycetota bacterium]
MTDGSSIFRPEALEARARVQTPGDVVRLGATWTTWAFWGLVALVAVALIAATQIEIRSFATGPTSRLGRRVAVLVPGPAAAEVVKGSSVLIGGREARVIAAGGRPMSTALVERRFGVEVDEPSVLIVTSARATASATGIARVEVGSDPVIVALVPGLRALFGDDDA